ncbi:MAG: hypothetical protein OSA43_12230, partial [Pirellulales bacterium]|nr:hypothetical protein [Pirellulales bacterium]
WKSEAHPNQTMSKVKQLATITGRISINNFTKVSQFTLKENSDSRILHERKYGRYFLQFQISVQNRRKPPPWSGKEFFDELH